MIEYWKNLSLDNLFYIDENGVVQEEEWRDVPEYEKIYRTSNLGRAKSLSRLKACGKGFFMSKDIVLKQSMVGKYLVVTLYKDKKSTQIKLSQLVGMSFLEHKRCGYELVVDHIINAEKTNNCVWNLQIITHRKNATKDRVNSLGFIGIKKNGNLFVARIQVNGRTINLGNFRTKEEASDIYKRAIKSLENGESVDDLAKITIKRNRPYKGYTLQKNKYVVRFKMDGLDCYLGTYETKKDALSIYEKAMELKKQNISFSFMLKSLESKPLKGIYRVGNRFKVILTIKGKRINVGSFKTIEIAIEKRDLVIKSS